MSTDLNHFNLTGDFNIHIDCQVRWCREGRTQMQNFSNQKGLFKTQKGMKPKTESAAVPDIKKTRTVYKQNKTMEKQDKTREDKTMIYK